MSIWRRGFIGVMVMLLTMVCGCARKKPSEPAPKAAAEAAAQAQTQAADDASKEQGEPVINAGDIMAGVDKNHDGKVTREEYGAIWKDKAVADRNFKMIDRNGDGVLSAEEFKPGFGTK